MSRYTISQLAALLEVSRQAVGKQLKKTPQHKRTVGKGWEYDLSDLPIEIQRRILEKLASKPASPEPAIAPVAPVAPAIPPANSHLALISQVSHPEILEAEIQQKPVFSPPKQPAPPLQPEQPPLKESMRRDARLHVLTLLDSYCQEHGLRTCECRNDFTKAYNQRELYVPDWVRLMVPDVSPTTLWRWRETLKTGELNKLAKTQGKKPEGWLIDRNPELREMVLGLILHRVTYIHKVLTERFPPEEVPSLRHLQAWVKQWKEEHGQEWALLQSKDLYNSKYRAAYGSVTEAITYALQELQVDATKGDIILADGKRHTLLLIEDAFSRRLKFLVCPTSNAKNLGQGLLRQVILDWGVPELIRTDRGKEFLSSYFLGCLKALEIEHKECNAFSPWEKPLVERAFGTNTRDLLENLSGYCGHSVAERKLIESRGHETQIKLTPKELQQLLNDWCAHYERQPHRGEGLEGKSPLQKWAESPKGVRSISDERLLDILLAEVPGNGGIRTVQKQGIQVGSGFYADDEGLWTLKLGQSVRVKLDPLGDAGVIYVFEPEFNGSFLFIATDSRLLGENRQAKAQKAHEVQRLVTGSVKRLKELAKAAEESAQPIPAGTSAKLYAFPLAQESFSTQGLRVAQEAIDAVQALEEPAQPKPLSLQEKRQQQQQIQQLEQLEADQIAETPGDRYRRLHFELRDGISISADDAAFMQRFERLPQGRCLKEVLEA